MQNPPSRFRKPAIALGLVAAGIGAVAITAALISRPDSSEPEQPAASDAAVEAVAFDPTTHILDDAGEGAPVFVEFLDFECEACGAVYPTIEELREEYAGEVTFAIRYFPIPSHLNSQNAALAAEAAARQGELEGMYSMLFETQSEWGELRDSEAPRFRQYAEELGLDLDQYDADIADPDVTDRVNFDFEAGLALGVAGTPTIFINEEMVELQSIDDIGAAIDSALAEGASE